jgi:hypothetical protein
MAHRFAGMRGIDILKLKKASIRQAPLPPESPSWTAVEGMIWEEIDDAAQRNVPGYKTIRKLLADQRFDK